MMLDAKKFPLLAKAIDLHCQGDCPPWRRIARALNYLTETRGTFSDDFSTEVETALVSGPAHAGSFDQETGSRVTEATSPWLGLLPSNETWTHGFTFMSLNDINRYLVRLPAIGAPPTIPLTNPMKFNIAAAKPQKRFIWVAGPDADRFSTGDQVVQELGLPHYGVGQIMYRVRIELTGRALFVPTAADAEFYEAWCFPVGRDPLRTGYTRHLCNGNIMHAELLTEVVDHYSTQFVATRVGSQHDAEVTAYSPDFLANRPEKDPQGYYV